MPQHGRWRDWPIAGESTYGVELSLAQSKPVPITLVILDRTLKYVGGVYSNQMALYRVGLM